MRVGETILNAKNGQRLIVRACAEPDAPLELEAQDPPGMAPSPMHVHPYQDESFRVIEGELTVEMNGTLHRLGPGQEILIPRGIAHAAWNSGAGPMRMQWRSLPGLRTFQFFQRLYELDDPARTRGALTRGLGLVRLMRDYSPEICVTKPARAVQRALFALVDALDRVSASTTKTARTFRNRP